MNLLFITFNNLKIINILYANHLQPDEHLFFLGY